VVGVQPEGFAELELDKFTATFSEPILQSSFTASAVIVTGPSGVIPVTRVRRLAAEVYAVEFATQYEEGDYSIEFLTTIKDSAGNPMNQDGDGINGEPEEDGYLHTVSLSASLLPDLVVSEISAPESAVAGQPVSLSWTIANLRENPTATAWHDAVFVVDNPAGANPQLLGTFVSGGPLAGDSSVERSVDIILPAAKAGTRHIQVVTDYFNVIPELTGELNNQSVDAEPVQVLAADLVVPEADIDTDMAIWGATIGVDWTVANSGTAAATVPWSDRIHLANPDTLQSIAVLGNVDAGAAVPLAAGDSALRSALVALPAPLTFADGTYAVFVEVNTPASQPESSRANNLLLAGTLTIAAAPLPDLHLSGLAGPASVESGADFTVEWTLHNSGNHVAAAPIRTRVSVSSSPSGAGARLVGIHEEPVDLAPGASRAVSATFTLPANAPNGAVYLVATVDPDNSLLESDEDNNTAVSGSTMLVPPRLSLSVSPDTFPENAGAAAATAWLTRNGAAAGPLLVELASSDTTEATVPASVTIPSGQSTVSFPVAAVPDGLLDGLQMVSLSATATGFPVAQAAVTVLDTDQPGLVLGLGTSSLLEGDASPATVSIPLPAPSAVTVYLTSSHPTDLVIPSSVVIPSGQTAFSFSVVARQNGTPQTDRFVVIEADADGYAAAQASLFIVDDDLDALTLTLSRSVISEGDGPNATLLTVARSPVTNAPVRVFLDTDSDRISAPASVVIPGGAASLPVNIGVVDNDLLDGSATVSITPRVTDPDHGGLVLAGEPAALTVLDDDGPALSLSLSASLAGEGIAGAAVLTFERNDGFDTPLQVMLASSDPSEVVVPASLVIPAGAAGAQAFIDTVDDGVTDGTQTVLITAEAEGYAPAAVEFRVTDTDLPDLVITGLSVQAEAYTENLFSLTYTIVNQGSVAAPGGFTQHLYLSDDPHVGDDTFLGAITLAGDLPPGESFTRSVSYFAPRKAGDYWIIAIADALGEVEEILELNNTVVSPDPVAVLSAYTAVISAGLDSAPVGTPIPLSGYATLRANGAPAANAVVSIHLKVRDTLRVFAAITNSVGQFETTFYPLPTEGGLYTVGAAHPGEPDAPVQDFFQILGIQPDPASPAVELIADGDPALLTIELRNLADVALTAVGAAAPQAPAGISVSTWFGAPGSASGTLPALGTATLGIEISATDTAPGNARLLIPITTAEGVSLNLPVDLTVKRLTPSLTADVDMLRAALIAGSGRIASFTLSNTGGAPSGPVAVSLPASLPWIQPVNGGELPSLAPGESIEVGFNLNPPAGLALGEYAGTIGFNAAGAALSLPFSFLNLSDASGDLVVITENELTYYAEGAPRIAGALVSLRDYFSGSPVAEATTNASGLASFSALTEGYYELEVSAPDHRTFRRTILVQAGILNSETAFLPYQSITYNWTVVPTTIEDRYQIVVETVFETNLPIPVVTVEPAHINLDELTQPVTQIDFTLSNQGLLAAGNTRFSFNAPSGWTIVPLIEDIGTLPAKSSITIPVVITNLALAGPAGALPMAGSCGGGAVDWTVNCGGADQGSSSPVGVSGGGGSGCGGGLGGGGGGGSGGGGGGGRVKISGGSGDCVPRGDFDPCVPKTLLLCGVGLLPIPGACIPSVLDCIIFFDSNAPVTSAGGCALAGVGCIPGLNVPANLMLCAGSLSLCWSTEGSGAAAQPVYAGMVAGGSAAPMSGAPDPDEGMAFYAYQIERYRELGQHVVDYHVMLMGGDHWFNGLLGDGFGDWNARLQGAVDESSEAGVRLSESERLLLLAEPLPEGLTSGQVEQFLDYWDNGVAYAEQGILRAADLPAGWDPNFLPFQDLQDIALLAAVAYDEAQADGFVDPFAALIHYRDLMIAYIGTHERPVYAVSAGATPQSGAGGVCARVRLRIEQEAVLARDAFDAHLEIINETDLGLEAIEVNLVISDESGNDATHLFQLRQPRLSGISAVDGGGSLSFGQTGSAQWIIVPAPEAAAVGQTRYFVSGYLRYLYDGIPVNVPLEAAPIEVLPTPKLALKYFHQRDVFSDDPFTDVVEPSLPFSLGIIVENQGAGTARDFSIRSSQPRIVDNEKGLLVDFQIVATQVDGQPLLPSLTAEFGDIPPGGRSVGQWIMTSSIQGLFIEYSATFEHVDAFGDPRLSLIDSVEVLEMIRPVSADDDVLTDFLVNEFPDDNDYPDSLYLGNGQVFRVSVSTSGTPDRAPQPNSLSVALSAAMEPGWSYLRIPDPGQGGFILQKVIRSDGSELPSANHWLTDRTFVGEGRPPVRENVLHLLDKDSDGEFTLVYAVPPVADSQPPASTVNPLPPESPPQFTVSWQGSDDTGVRDYSIHVSTDNGPFLPWLRDTTLTQARFSGDPDTRYAFYSIARDFAGNIEQAPAAADASTFTSVTNSAPVIAAVADRSLDEGDLLDFIVSAADPDPGQSVRFSFAGDYPVGMSIHPVSGRLTWQSGETHGGSAWTIQVIATDDGVPPASDAISFALTVNEVNSPPAIVAPSPRQVAIGNTLSLWVEAEDGDLPAQQLVYSLGHDSPAGAAIDPDTGGFSWTPGLADIGNHDIAVLVSDGVDESSVILPVLVTLPERYHNWKQRFWPGVSDLAIIGYDADPDNDRVINLAEYALGMDPTQPSAHQGPALQVVTEGSRYLGVAFQRPTSHAAYSYELQAADMLEPDAWETVPHDAAITPDPLIPGIERVRFRDLLADTQYQRRFLRLSVADNTGPDSWGDANGNGIDDLLEAALALNIDSPVGSAMPRLESVLMDRVSHLRIGFVQRVDDPRLRVEVIASSDLHAPDSEWEVISDIVFSTENNLPLGFTRFLFRDPADSSMYDKRFIKLRYTYE
jgi:uncharacterized membrane protein YgcG